MHQSTVQEWEDLELVLDNRAMLPNLLSTTTHFVSPLFSTSVSQVALQNAPLVLDRYFFATHQK